MLVIHSSNQVFVLCNLALGWMTFSEIKMGEYVVYSDPKVACGTTTKRMIPCLVEQDKFLTSVTWIDHLANLFVCSSWFSSFLCWKSKWKFWSPYLICCSKCKSKHNTIPYSYKQQKHQKIQYLQYTYQFTLGLYHFTCWYICAMFLLCVILV